MSQTRREFMTRLAGVAVALGVPLPTLATPDLVNVTEVWSPVMPLVIGQPMLHINGVFRGFGVGDAATAIGVEPTRDRRAISRVLGRLPLLRSPTRSSIGRASSCNKGEGSVVQNPPGGSSENEASSAVALRFRGGA